jgi:hypothetical protein
VAKLSDHSQKDLLIAEIIKSMTFDELKYMAQYWNTVTGESLPVIEHADHFNDMANAIISHYTLE